MEKAYRPKTSSKRNKSLKSTFESDLNEFIKNMSLTFMDLRPRRNAFFKGFFFLRKTKQAILPLNFAVLNSSNRF